MSTIKANTLLHSDGSTTTQPSIPALAPAMAKAWVRFNGSGTVGVMAGYNVSSVTDLGTGQYRVNYTTNLSSDNYSVVVSTSGASYSYNSRPNDLTTSNCAIDVSNGSSAYRDDGRVYAVIFGN